MGIQLLEQALNVGQASCRIHLLFQLLDVLDDVVGLYSILLVLDDQVPLEIKELLGLSLNLIESRFSLVHVLVDPGLLLLEVALALILIRSKSQNNYFSLSSPSAFSIPTYLSLKPFSVFFRFIMRSFVSFTLFIASSSNIRLIFPNILA